jgi:hypothetical protein
MSVIRLSVTINNFLTIYPEKYSHKLEISNNPDIVLPACELHVRGAHLCGLLAFLISEQASVILIFSVAEPYHLNENTGPDHAF